MSIARGIRFETGRLVMLRSIDLNNEPLIEQAKSTIKSSIGTCLRK